MERTQDQEEQLLHSNHQEAGWLAEVAACQWVSDKPKEKLNQNYWQNLKKQMSPSSS